MKLFRVIALTFMTLAIEYELIILQATENILCEYMHLFYAYCI